MPIADHEVRLHPSTLVAQMATDVRRGLTARRKWLPPKYFYDARGSELFDKITRLPEYYPTRTERAILTERVGEIAALTRAETLVELGSGTSDKTRLLLDALHREGTLRRFAPFDVDPSVLAEAAVAIAAQFPTIEVAPIVGDFEHHLGDLPRHARRLVAFLGSTIGNLDPDERHRFLTDLRSTLGPGDAFLLGTDLVKPAGRLVPAYDDAQGVTAEFNKNVLVVLNRELGADFEPDLFEHRAVWSIAHEWIEMRLRSKVAQTVTIRDLDLVVGFDAGEDLRTEISAKFRAVGVAAELAAAGLELEQWWTDPAGDFALSLSVPSQG
jgi:L-histidine N-alpha-methyltransferase